MSDCVWSARLLLCARIGPPIGAHSNSLAAPNQLSAAFAEAAPTAKRVFARPSVGFSVPALHRTDADAVTNRHALELKSGAKRGVRSMCDDVVTRHGDTE